MAVWEKNNRAVEEDAGVRREMGVRAGRGESWCDPLDGSIQGVVGLELGENGKQQVCVETNLTGEPGREALSFCPAQRLRIGWLARPKRALSTGAPPGFSAAAQRVQLQQGAPASPASQATVLIYREGCVWVLPAQRCTGLSAPQMPIGIFESPLRLWILDNPIHDGDSLDAAIEGRHGAKCRRNRLRGVLRWHRAAAEDRTETDNALQTVPGLRPSS
jgi:hypothetical protein